jgi:hypothetical protein
LDKGILATVEKNARGGVGPPANRVKDCLQLSIANFGLAPKGDRI